MSKQCINCRQRPEGPTRVGVTDNGHVFISKACEPCQQGVDRAVAALVALRWPEVAA